MGFGRLSHLGFMKGDSQDKQVCEPEGLLLPLQERGRPPACGLLSSKQLPEPCKW